MPERALTGGLLVGTKAGGLVMVAGCFNESDFWMLEEITCVVMTGAGAGVSSILVTDSRF